MPDGGAEKSGNFFDVNDPAAIKAVGDIIRANFAGDDVTRVNATFGTAADFLGNGAIELPFFESQIVDLVRRDSVALERFEHKKATGHPHRYLEQTAIATAGFTDPRNISPSATGPTRTERFAPIKAITNQTNFSLFDVEVTQQQGQFSSIENLDLEDLISSCIITSGTAIWQGTDTSFSSPSTTQYFGLLGQITFQATIASGASIVDGLKAQVAAMIAQTGFKVKPSAVYCNPLALDYLEREAKASNIVLGQLDIGAGVTVKTLNTQAGPLPLITDVFIPSSTGSAFGFAAPPTGLKNYYFAIITERMVEMPYISGRTENPRPRIFQLGLASSLAGQYVAILFDCVIGKGATYAHSVVALQRP